MNLKQKLTNFIISGTHIKSLKVKHMKVTSEHTLTTPKIIITNSSTDPVNNGEITRNGTTIKAETEGAVKEF